MQVISLWRILALSVSYTFITTGVAFSQTSTSEDNEAAQQHTENTVVRIPAHGLAAALRASQDGRSSRARTISQGPNLDAMREDLQRTRDADAERRTANTGPEITSVPIRRPRPGLRVMSAEQKRNMVQEEIDRVFVPLLLPAHPDLGGKVKIYGMRNIYTATADINVDTSFSMSGTCNRVIGGDPKIAAFRKRLASKPRRLPGTGAEYHISRNDYGVDLSFSKFGCGYVMTIECNNPGSDLHCANDDYITELGDSLVLANPNLAGGE